MSAYNLALRDPDLIIIPLSRGYSHTTLGRSENGD
jgi:hypothetical protein